MNKVIHLYLFIGMISIGFSPAAVSGAASELNTDQLDQITLEEERGEAAPSSPEKSERNPFSETEVIQKKAEQRKSNSPLPPKLPEGMPNLALRGYIEGPDAVSAALLEVQGFGVYLIRPGDLLNLHSGQQNIVLKIEKIGYLNAVVAVGSRGPVIVVR
ncbi:MAG: hypothetical protein LLH30_19150 [Candidatus Manganitrophus sp. SA1]|nr:hypothetical protein [Candidatus Manganitrophus morganii]